MFRRLLRIGLAVATALIVGVPSCVVWHSRDLPEVQDADLTIPPLVIEDEESNAYTHLERAAAVLAWPEDLESSPRLGEDWDPRTAEQLVASNDLALAHLHRALEAPHFQVPRQHMLDPDYDPCPLGLSNLMLANVLASRAYLRADRGETRAALEDALTLVRFGHRLQQAHRAELIHMMSGGNLKSLGLRVLRDVAAHAPLDAALARKFEARLKDFETEPETWSRAWAWEYQDLKGMMEHTLSEQRNWQFGSTLMVWLAEAEVEPALVSLLPNRYLLHRNRLLILEAEFMRSMQRDSFKPCSQLEPPTEFVPEDRIGKLRMMLSPNSAGRFLLAISTPNFRDFQFRRCESDTTLAATRVVLALEAYRNERGALPGSLEELVSEFLSEVPRDGFDGAPLRYLPERALIYSVGRDLVDGGGLVGVDERDLDEPIFRLGKAAATLDQGAGG